MQKFFNRTGLNSRDRHLTKNKFIVASACGIAPSASSWLPPSLESEQALGDAIGRLLANRPTS